MWRAGEGFGEVEVNGGARFGRTDALVKVTGKVKGWVGQVEPSQAKRVGER